MMNNQKGRLQEVSLYVHIPFCVQKCRYCDFLSAPCDPEKREAYVQALIREINAQGEKLKERIVKSIFFGGGTPSLLETDQLIRIADALKSTFPLWAEDLEWTLEANPGTVNPEKARCWYKVGINRISMGMQSADDKLLKKLGRIHQSREVPESIDILKGAGFTNLSLDLMMGLPGQDLINWQQTLEEALRFKVNHLSCYSLIIEEGTPFYEEEKKGKLDLPDEDTERAMYEWTLQRLSKAGFRQYEISNFALPGYESRHNKVYWEMGEYVGLGLGAASYLNGKRLRNESDLDRYCLSVDPTELQILEEEVTEKAAMEEFMFMGLRENQGVSRNRFFRFFGTDIENVYGDTIRKLVGEGLLITESDRLYLSRKGLDLANRVFASFLMDP